MSTDPLLSNVDPEAIRLAEFCHAVIDLVQQHSQSDKEELHMVAMSLCLLGVKQGKEPDELMALIRDAWPAAALAIISDMEATR